MLFRSRIGRTGRAGRNGLAVTLAERMDTGMIRRIQQFTTQNIPVGVITGLEPKTPEPKMFAPRPDSGPGARFGGKPSFGKKPFAPRHGQGFAPRHNEGFAPRNEGFAPRGGESFAPRGGEGYAPRGGAAFERKPFDKDARFEPRAPHQDRKSTR